MFIDEFQVVSTISRGLCSFCYAVTFDLSGLACHGVTVAWCGVVWCDSGMAVGWRCVAWQSVGVVAWCDSGMAVGWRYVAWQSVRVVA